MNAFITGSRAYGKPQPESDIDLVIRVESSTADNLEELSGVKNGEPVRFGKLNLILCRTDEEYALWKMGTAQMLHEKRIYKQSFSQIDAKNVLNTLRNLLGMQDLEQSGGR